MKAKQTPIASSNDTRPAQTLDRAKHNEVATQAAVDFTGLKQGATFCYCTRKMAKIIVST
eukprot:scaffold4449_cov49-Prasinocladus_malaysianus.AAC.3